MRARARSVLLIAHRGASAVAPESTAAAIREAARAGADMVELDVQMTSDQRLIIFHDDRLNRTTDGRGPVRRTPYAALRRLDAGAWFHPRFAGQPVLLLSQALRLTPRRMGMNLELKRTARRAALLRRLPPALRHAGGRRLLISSFDARLLTGAALGRRAKALICRRRPERSLRTAIRLGCRAWHPHAALVTRRRVEAAHAAGLRVHAWTVDRLGEARRLLAAGVDGLFTNDPARLRRGLARR
jgi:glycerophosphoryl diester phosphodiesterase